MDENDTKMVSVLKERLSDVATPEFTDFDFLRWLQGYDYNLDLIETNLRYHFHILRSYDFLKNSDSYDLLNKYWPLGIVGPTGKDNNILMIETLPLVDAEGIYKSVPKSIVGVWCFHLTERFTLNVIRQRESETGQQSGLLIIQDMAEHRLNPKQISMLMGPYRKLVDSMLAHYSEILQKYIVINMPSVFNVIWNVIKPLLPQKTQQKFVVLGSNWRKEILEYVSADMLPAYWGGTMVDEDGDPRCSRKLGTLSKVPESLYWLPDNNNKPEMFKILNVRAGTVEFVCVEIREPHLLLEWSFYADSDWGFSVFFSNNEADTDVTNMEMVYPQASHIPGETIVMEKGCIECKKCGFYKLWFSNSFSWFRKLQIRYQIKISSSGRH